MNTFNLTSYYNPSGDQPQAIEKLVNNIQSGVKEQVLVGVTGSGKTFTMANAIARMNRPTLVLSHNKTLAAQLFQEFREFFPKNAISYFVSYYDFYQPECYIPQTDTYIEKETEINEEIDKLRLAATTNLLTRNDTIVVASISCIYNIGSPREYGHFVLELKRGMKVEREAILTRLVALQYERNDFGFKRGTFRVRGGTIDLFPAYEDIAVRLITDANFLISLETIDPLTGKRIEHKESTVIYPSKHYMTDPASYKRVFEQIREDAANQEAIFKKNGKFIEAQRISERVNFDLEMLAELGYVKGIENYSRYFDGRAPGDPPYTLFDYFEEATHGKGLSDGWLLFIDESHMSIPQVRGMYNGDRSRKQTLIDYGFRLPAALDNRPLRFDEFLRRIPQTVYVSATPDEWEIERATEGCAVIPSDPPAEGDSKDPLKTSGGKGYVAKQFIVEQLVRPTGLLDPQITVRPVKHQIEDLLGEIDKRIARGERVLVTTLTKRMAEDLSKFLEERTIKVHYLHSDITTLDRSDILSDLRLGKYDVIVGINLLREGLDLPEVSLVAILDADKEGFLRSKISLIQTMGRAARNVSGEVILYADTITKSIAAAVSEVKRRRRVQVQYNEKHKIKPQTIIKPIRSDVVTRDKGKSEKNKSFLDMTEKTLENLTPHDKKKLIRELTTVMRRASDELEFEAAARIRDTIARLKE